MSELIETTSSSRIKMAKIKITTDYQLLPRNNPHYNRYFPIFRCRPCFYLFMFAFVLFCSLAIRCLMSTHEDYYKELLSLYLNFGLIRAFLIVRDDNDDDDDDDDDGDMMMLIMTIIMIMVIDDD